MKYAVHCLQTACFWVFLALNALAQTPISGKVTGEQNDGIPGVTVSVKGTTRGTTTDATGTFRLNAAANETLVFSYVGYTSQEVQVGSQTDFSIKLLPDTRSLEELVVVGYSTVRKSDLTGSVSTIKAEAIKEMPVVSVDQAIQARAAGVQVTQSSASPGGGISIRVRGANFINSGSEPLYVIDGFPVYPDNGAIGTGGQRRGAHYHQTGQRRPEPGRL